GTGEPAAGRAHHAHHPPAAAPAGRADAGRPAHGHRAGGAVPGRDAQRAAPAVRVAGVQRIPHLPGPGARDQPRPHAGDLAVGRGHSGAGGVHGAGAGVHRGRPGDGCGHPADDPVRRGASAGRLHRAELFASRGRREQYRALRHRRRHHRRTGGDAARGRVDAGALHGSPL
ncbi:MAG: COG3448: CBS-domain-containing membrane protein, partial [uncultured Gemmatimonadetes bacterium]